MGDTSFHSDTVTLDNEDKALLLALSALLDARNQIVYLYDQAGNDYQSSTNSVLKTIDDAFSEINVLTKIDYADRLTK